MKSTPLPLTRRAFAKHFQPGFALIVTLSLMILLTVIAVGLLTLSSISIRSAGQGDAMARARANARMAILMAIGELQKNAGLDQRITARADVLGENIANPRLTGVWNSWEITPAAQASDYEKVARDARFRGWLVSGNPIESSKIGFAGDAPLSIVGSANKPAPAVTLWDKGSLGANPFAKSVVIANKVPLVSSRGAMAWAVMDEGVKARIDLPYVEDAATVGQKIAQLGSGQSPNVAAMSGADPIKDKDSRPLENLAKTFFLQDSVEFAKLKKGITRSNFALAGDQVAAGVGPALRPLVHDITVNSTGLFTDTARGGLKQDMQLMMDAAALPSNYASQGVYASRGITKDKELSDPTWESLRQYARLHNDKTKLNNTGGVPVLKASAPQGWFASTRSGDPAVTTINRKTPPGVLLMPSIAKVQLVFSLVGRDIYNYPWNGKPGSPPPPPATKTNLHGPLDDHFKKTKYHYDLHLLYTPVVTLHNPYNVAIEFTEMKFEFVRVPFSMQVFRNGGQHQRSVVAQR